MNFAPFINRRSKKSQSGSAMILVLIAVVLLGMTAMAAMRINDMLGRDNRELRTKGNIEGVTHVLQNLLRNGEICLDGVDGVFGPQQGLRFEDAAGNPSTFNSALAATPAGQPVRVGTNFDDPNSLLPLTLRSGERVTEFNLTIDRLYMTASPLAGSPGVYRGQIMASVDTTLSDVSLKDKALSQIEFRVDGANNVTSCALVNAAVTAESMCTAMGCNFGNPDPNAQQCVCPLPAADCPTGQYIAGLDPITLDPYCQTVEVRCPANQYLVAIDSAGEAVCSTVSVAAAPPPPPVPGPPPPPPPPPPPSGTDCPATTLSWTVGANTCSAPVVLTLVGASNTARDLTRPTTGFGTFQCTAAGWSAAPDPNATCATSVPMAAARSMWHFVNHPSAQMCMNGSDVNRAMGGNGACPISKYHMPHPPPASRTCNGRNVQWCITCAPGSDTANGLCLRDLDLEAAGPPG